MKQPMQPMSAGCSAHLGAGVTPEGVNFCIYSKFATAVELLIFDREDAADPGQNYVVVNHTVEADERGSTCCFCGLAHEANYLLERDDRRR